MSPTSVRQSLAPFNEYGGNNITHDRIVRELFSTGILRPAHNNSDKPSLKLVSPLASSSSLTLSSLVSAVPYPDKNKDAFTDQHHDGAATTSTATTLATTSTSSTTSSTIRSSSSMDMVLFSDNLVGNSQEIRSSIDEDELSCTLRYRPYSPSPFPASTSISSIGSNNSINSINRQNLSCSKGRYSSCFDADCSMEQDGATTDYKATNSALLGSSGCNNERVVINFASTPLDGPPLFPMIGNSNNSIGNTKKAHCSGSSIRSDGTHRTFDNTIVCEDDDGDIEVTTYDGYDDYDYSDDDDAMIRRTFSFDDQFPSPIVQQEQQQHQERQHQEQQTYSNNYSNNYNYSHSYNNNYSNSNCGSHDYNNNNYSNSKANCGISNFLQTITSTASFCMSESNSKSKLNFSSPLACTSMEEEDDFDYEHYYSSFSRDQQQGLSFTIPITLSSNENVSPTSP